MTNFQVLLESFHFLFANYQKNDAEAVLVREGCVFVGYDHEKGMVLHFLNVK